VSAAADAVVPMTKLRRSMWSSLIFLRMILSENRFPLFGITRLLAGIVVAGISQRRKPRDHRTVMRAAFHAFGA